MANLALIAPASYCTPAASAWWRWEDAEGVLCWQQGTTVAFRGELAQHLEHLAPDGLPPLELVLLLLAACRPSWPSVAGEAAAYLGRAASGLSDEEAASLLAGLHRVQALPRAARISAAAVTTLLEMALQRVSQRTTPAVATAIVAQLQEGQPLPRCAPAPPASAGSLRALAAALSRLDVAALAQCEATGWEGEISIAALLPQTAEAIEELLATLRGDDRLGELIEAAHNLRAAWPAAQRLPDPQQRDRGGVADLSHRGNLDRLLPSELAHDDETLLARVALDEALYLRHEETQPSTAVGRAVLIDGGLRMWGAPRWLALAAALALAASNERGARVLAYRALGPRVEPLDLGTRGGLLQYLSKLDLRPLQPAALRAFCEITRRESRTPSMEQLLITSGDGWRDRGLQRTLASVGVALKVAAVERDGRLTVHRWHPHGSVAELHLQVEVGQAQPWSPRKPPRALSQGIPYPAAWLANPIPFRCTWLQLRPHAVAHTERGLVAISAGRQLVLYDRRDWTPRILAPHLPGNCTRIVWAAFEPAGTQLEALLAPVQRPGATWLSWNAATGAVQIRELHRARDQNWITGGFIQDNIALTYESYRGGGWRFRCRMWQRDGQEAEGFEIPSDAAEAQPIEGRVWRQGHCWSALHYDGLNFRLLPIVEHPDVIGVVWSPSHGWVAFTNRGTAGVLADTHPPRWLDSGTDPCAFRGATCCGRYVRLARPSAASGSGPPTDTETLIWFDVQQLCVVPADAASAQAPQNEPEWGPFVPRERGGNRPPWFRVARVDQSGTSLWLRSSRQWWVLGLTENGLRSGKSSLPKILSLQRWYRRGEPVPGLASQDERRSPQTAQKFAWEQQAQQFAWENVEGHPGLRFSVARWPGGGWLAQDPTGFLHLGDDEGRVPSCTLSLQPHVEDGDCYLVAGWAADGRLWGPSEALFLHPNITYEDAYRSLFQLWCQTLLCPDSR